MGICYDKLHLGLSYSALKRHGDHITFSGMNDHAERGSRDIENLFLYIQLIYVSLKMYLVNNP